MRWQVNLERCPVTDLKTARIKLERVDLESWNVGRQTFNFAKIATKNEIEKKKGRFLRPMVSRVSPSGIKKNDKVNLVWRPSNDLNTAMKKLERINLKSWNQGRQTLNLA